MSYMMGMLGIVTHRWSWGAHDSLVSFWPRQAHDSSFSPWSLRSRRADGSLFSWLSSWTLRSKQVQSLSIMKDWELCKCFHHWTNGRLVAEMYFIYIQFESLFTFSPSRPGGPGSPTSPWEIVFMFNANEQGSLQWHVLNHGMHGAEKLPQISPEYEYNL